MEQYIEESRVGEQRKEFKYTYFLPSTINNHWKWHTEVINTLLQQVQQAMQDFMAGEQSSFVSQLYTSLAYSKESLAACRIEGIVLAWSDIYAPDFVSESLAHAINKEDVEHYLEALLQIPSLVAQYPLSTRVFHELHHTLLQSQRWHKQTPGEYRKSQNWVGADRLEQASFVPPHHSHLHALMSDYENFIHTDFSINPYIQMALLHYQFITIHPYLAGNLRMNHLITHAFMLEKKISPLPILLSSVLERKKYEYFDALQRTREQHSLFTWVEFFLRSLHTAIELSSTTLRKTNEFINSLPNVLQPLENHAERAIKVLHKVAVKPIISSAELQELCMLPPNTIQELMLKFRDLDIVDIVETPHEPLYYCTPIIDIWFAQSPVFSPFRFSQ